MKNNGKHFNCIATFFKERIRKVMKSPLKIFVIAGLLVTIIILALKNDSGTLIALAGILVGVITPVFAADTEIEKEKATLSLEKKHEAYQKMMTGLYNVKISLSRIKEKILDKPLPNISKELSDAFKKSKQELSDIVPIYHIYFSTDIVSCYDDVSLILTTLDISLATGNYHKIEEDLQSVENIIEKLDKIMRTELNIE
ncbi:MAG: hypothetical protein FWF35_00300 [Elusimicrobia bacterium]|nr:hypothetical protein [Elusimicrobiota bacterium]